MSRKLNSIDNTCRYRPRLYYRGISLLSVPGKILPKVLLNLLQPLSESIILETQCGFRPGRNTKDMISSAQRLQEKCREQGRDICLAFIDLTKAFESEEEEETLFVNDIVTVGAV